MQQVPGQESFSIILHLLTTIRSKLILQSWEHGRYHRLISKEHQEGHWRAMFYECHTENADGRGWSVTRFMFFSANLLWPRQMALSPCSSSWWPSRTPRGSLLGMWGAGAIPAEVPSAPLPDNTEQPSCQAHPGQLLTVTPGCQSGLCVADGLTGPGKASQRR